MPQGKDKEGWESAEFKVMLPNINLLYLFCGVLVLADLSYVSRFWVRAPARATARATTCRGLSPFACAEAALSPPLARPTSPALLVRRARPRRRSSRPS